MWASERGSESGLNPLRKQRDLGGRPHKSLSDSRIPPELEWEKKLIRYSENKTIRASNLEGCFISGFGTCVMCRGWVCLRFLSCLKVCWDHEVLLQVSLCSEYCVQHNFLCQMAFFLKRKPSNDSPDSPLLNLQVNCFDADSGWGFGLRKSVLNLGASLGCTSLNTVESEAVMSFGDRPTVFQTSSLTNSMLPLPMDKNIYTLIIKHHVRTEFSKDQLRFKQLFSKIY